MIALLRTGAFAVNCGVVVAVGRVCGLPWPAVAAACGVFFVLSWWACGVVPASSPAPPEWQAAAARVAARMDAPAPNSVATLPGRMAAAARAGTGGGYTLLLGNDLEPSHLDALIAHEIAHAVVGDLRWEPWTDGPARLLVPWARACAPVWVLAFPFLVFGAPLARLTELRADRLAARAVPSYPLVLKEFTDGDGATSSLLYPPIRDRLRETARDSKNNG